MGNKRTGRRSPHGPAGPLALEGRRPARDGRHRRRPALRPPPQAPCPARQAHRDRAPSARLLPARWACLEESVTAALALAVAGRGAHWRHGVATDPVRLHAWLASPDGTPVEEPPSTGAYTITHTVRPPRRTP
ncbi:lasso peptide biosynthesis B2 protein [Streptomyces sp. Iso 434]|uniref:lasso peptide biosynthesis B2 protein n=1 Tax=Streptomyces sp. Iso 434 TaxID=3062272 RepID=UPI0039807F4E